MSRVVEIRRAVMADIPLVSEALRDAERKAVAETGRSVEEVVRYCFANSSRRRTALVDGEIAAMWGCGGPLLGTYGEPWLFATKAIERAPMTAVKVARRELDAMGRMFPVLSGILYRADARACRFAERMGLRITQDYGDAFVRYARVG